VPVSASHTGGVDVCPPPPEPVLWPESGGENPFARKEPPDPLLLIPDWAGPEPWREVEALLLEDALVMEDGETGRQTSESAASLDRRGPGGKSPDTHGAWNPRAGRQTSESAASLDRRDWAANVRTGTGPRIPGLGGKRPNRQGPATPGSGSGVTHRLRRRIPDLGGRPDHRGAREQGGGEGLGRPPRVEPHEQSGSGRSSEPCTLRFVFPAAQAPGNRRTGRGAARQRIPDGFADDSLETGAPGAPPARYHAARQTAVPEPDGTGLPGRRGRGRNLRPGVSI